MHINQIEKNDFTDYLNAYDQNDLLRFIICGSVDDGKSTLIGRLLFESKLIYDDQLKLLTDDSKKYGTTGDNLDFALLVDGLSSEREQGITIDVAYRFFSTEKRKFIAADTPGHEQYTRNMATGASTAEVALVMVDAKKGISTQTWRHSFIVNMLGIKKMILVINKMDLVGYDPAVYERIKEEYLQFSQPFKTHFFQAIPVSALQGDGITTSSCNMPWYCGPTLMQCLEEMPIEQEIENKFFRMPVQWVNRPNSDFRGFSGRICAGTIKPGELVKVLPGGQESIVSRIVTYDSNLKEARSGQSITLTLEDEIDVSRGDMLVSAQTPCEVADQFTARILWLAEKPMISGRQYWFKSNTNTGLCTPSKPKYLIDINTLNHLATKELSLNEIGDCEISLDKPIPFEPYHQNRELGSFILIDRITNATVGAGFIHYALRRSTNVHAQKLLVNKEKRASIKEQKPIVLWFTGLSGAGKSTIANLVEQLLNLQGKHSMLLDGDNMRQGLNHDLDFTEAGRAENIRRIAEVAKLMTDAGLITLVSCISPFFAERDMARRLIGSEQFIEIFVDVSLTIAEARDVKGLYKKARMGEIQNFTGIGSPYEIPQNPDLHLDTTRKSPQESANRVLTFLREKEIIY